MRSWWKRKIENWYTTKMFYFKNTFLKPSSFLLSFFFVPHDDGVATASVEFGQQIFHFCVLKSLFNLTFLTVLIINKVWEEKLINNSNVLLFLLNIFLEKLIMNDKHMTLSYVHIYCIFNDKFMQLGCQVNFQNKSENQYVIWKIN